MTVNADRILAIIAHLERSGEVEMAADLRSLHIEYEHLRALASQTRVTLREVLDALEVDDEFELARLHGRQIGGFFALENTPDIANVLSPNLAGVRPIAP